MQKADQIYFNGSIQTMDNRASYVQAVAVQGDTILGVGNKEEILAEFKGDNTIMTDLKGKTMLPGFVDPHGHFAWAGLCYVTAVDLAPTPLGDTNSIADIQRKIAEQVAVTPKGEWIIGMFYDDTAIKENRHPYASELDAVSPDHPVMISQVSGHVGVANSKALELAGVNKDTIDPVGGQFRRNPDGTPNGVCEETAMFMIRHIQPKPTFELMIEGIREASARYTAKGVTSAQDGATDKNTLELLYKANEMGVLKNRVQIFPCQLMGEVPKLNSVQSGTQLTDDKMISLGAMKTFIDGSIQGYTGFLSNPYHEVLYDELPNEKFWCGYPTKDYAAFATEIKEYHRAGWQIACHGNGDAAIQYIIDAIEEAQKSFPRDNARHMIIHCQTVREDQLDKMKRLGIIPAFFVVHTYYWGDRHRDIFLGEDRARRISPCASAMLRGMVFTNHNDTMVTPIDPLLSVWSATNRITSSGKVLGPDQRVPVLEALRAVTSYAAYQACEDTIKGTLEPGKLADFVILEENPLTIDPVKIKDIKIEATIVGNKVVYGDLPK